MDHQGACTNPGRPYLLVRSEAIVVDSSLDCVSARARPTGPPWPIRSTRRGRRARAEVPACRIALVARRRGAEREKPGRDHSACKPKCSPHDRYRPKSGSTTRLQGLGTAEGSRDQERLSIERNDTVSTKTGLDHGGSRLVGQGDVERAGAGPETRRISSVRWSSLRHGSTHRGAQKSGRDPHPSFGARHKSGCCRQHGTIESL